MSEAQLMVRVGVLLRRSFRRCLIRNGLSYAEHRGLLDSMFVITGSRRELEQLMRLANGEA